MDIVNTLQCAGINLDVHGTPSNPLFRATHIAKVLGISNIGSSIRDFGMDKKVLQQVHTRGGYQTVIFLTLVGLRHLVTVSRKPKAIEIAKLLGIDVIPCKVSTFEASTLRQIMEAFDGEVMDLQYPIGPFFIDLYLPRYKLAIECDEQQHDTNFEKEKDATRQAYITSQLCCTFIRYKPHTDCFSIFQVINQIYTHIKQAK